MVLLPAMGIVAEVVCVFARKLFAYKLILYSSIGLGILSFFVWAQQFISGRSARDVSIHHDDFAHFHSGGYYAFRFHCHSLWGIDSFQHGNVVCVGFHCGVPPG